LQGVPATDLSAFSRWPDDDQFLIGYRTKNQPVRHGPDYEYDREYEAPWLFLNPAVDCAPGLYVCPTIDAVKKLHPEATEIIRVVFLPGEALKAVDKYRCKRFYVLPLEVPR